jgi:transcriptional regulator with GAF, ATPase, and Fis domain
VESAAWRIVRCDYLHNARGAIARERTVRSRLWSFTGAVNDKPGRLEAGHGGTVLFDEIAELRTSLQTKLFRFIQEHRFERIGSDRTISLIVRLLAASNRNLEAEVGCSLLTPTITYRLQE